MHKSSPRRRSPPSHCRPVANAWPSAARRRASRRKKKVVVVTKTIQGAVPSTCSWGPVQVTIVVKGNEDIGDVRATYVPTGAAALGVHQQAGDPDAAAGGAAGSRARKIDLIWRRDDDERGVRRVAPGGAPRRPKHLTSSSRSGSAASSTSWGCRSCIDVRDDEVAAAAVDAAFDWLRFVDATFSTYKDDSEISRLNRGELALDDAHPTCAGCSTDASELREETGGYFDARAGRRRRRPVGPRQGLVGRPGGRDSRRRRRSQLLRSTRAATSACAADPSPERSWRVGIQHPLVADRVAAVVEGERSRDGDVGRVRARRSTSLEPAHRPPAERRALGDGDRPGARRPPTRTRPPRSRWATAGPHWTARLRRLRGDDDPRRRDGDVDRSVPRSRRRLGSLRATRSGRRDSNPRPSAWEVTSRFPVSAHLSLEAPN